MARQIGDIKITGTFDDLSFYISEGQYLVRMKGGPTKKQIMHSPAFARTRENISEFGAGSQAGAFLRSSLKNVLPLSDPYAYRRMTRLMSQIKNYDLCSGRGERTVSEGLKHPEAKLLLCDFDFNPASPLNMVMLKKAAINNKHELLFDAKAFSLPPGAAHAVVSGALLNLDFDNKSASRFLYKEGMIFAGQEHQSLKLSLGDCPKQKNKRLYFLALRFYAKDGVALQQGALDASGFIAVDPDLASEPKIPTLKGEPLIMPLSRVLRKKLLIHLVAHEIFPLKSPAPE